MACSTIKSYCCSIYLDDSLLNMNGAGRQGRVSSTERGTSSWSISSSLLENRGNNINADRPTGYEEITKSATTPLDFPNRSPTGGGCLVCRLVEVAPQDSPNFTVNISCMSAGHPKQSDHHIRPSDNRPSVHRVHRPRVHRVHRQCPQTQGRQTKGPPCPQTQCVHRVHRYRRFTEERRVAEALLLLTSSACFSQQQTRKHVPTRSMVQTIQNPTEYTAGRLQ